MSLRILFATHAPPDPATAVFATILRRADFLREQGHIVDIVTPADLPTGQWPRLQPVLLPVVLSARDLRRYDAVVFHSYLAWAHALVRARLHRDARPAMIVEFHGLEPLYHWAVETELQRTGESLSRRFRLLHTGVLPPLIRLACRRAARVICLNTQEREFLVESGWAEATRVAVVPNGVSSELLRERRGYRPVATRLLFTAQWLRAKGTRYLAEAFDRVRAIHPATELTCLGTGAGRETVLRDFAASHSDHVRVVPRFDPEQMLCELSRADLFVFPSLYEGFGNALAEAMASGLPVVATPTGPAADVITTGVNGVLVPFADARELADAVVRLIPDASSRESLGSAARETARGYEWRVTNEVFAAEVLRGLQAGGDG